ncbi:MAG: tetratricopeptide repeat protein [Myxococcota bacterium]
MMDVSCPQCTTEFELERAQIPAEGLPVKCSECDYVFRAFAPKEPASDSLWKVRQGDGNTFEFKELTTLQRWIVERKVSRDDEISKKGNSWKRLGDIAELATFFNVVEEAKATPSPAALALQSASRPDAWQLGETDSIPRRNTADFSKMALEAHEPTEDTPPKKPSSTAGLWLLTLLVVVLFIVGGLYVFKPPIVSQLLDPGPPAEALKQVESGYRELAKDSDAAITSAIEHFEKAIVLSQHHVEAKAGLAEALLIKAEWLRLQATDLQDAAESASPAQKPTLLLNIETMGVQTENLVERAFNVATEALALDSQSLAANRAMADYYRFKNALAQMQESIDHARAVVPGDAAVGYISALAQLGQDAQKKAAMSSLEEILRRHPELQRARYRLARAYFEQGESDKAQRITEEILKSVPEHERAQSLLQKLQVVAKKTAAVESEPQDDEETEKPTAGPVPVQKLLRQATRLRQADKPRMALRLFEKVLDQEPHNLDAMIGMGWCYIDLEEHNAAMATFQEILKRAPRFSDAHMGMAEVYHLKGMKRDAVKHYQKYLEILPNGSDAAVARRMLEQLQ